MIPPSSGQAPPSSGQASPLTSEEASVLLESFLRLLQFLNLTSAPPKKEMAKYLTDLGLKLGSKARVASVGNVYLLHYEKPIRGKKHYLGFTMKKVAMRLQEHNSGWYGSQMTNLAVQNGSECVLARTWEGVSVQFEKKLKREKNLKRHCPICKNVEFEVNISEDGASGPVPPEAG